MNETYYFLKKTEVNYISTINGDKPSCRPFGAPIIFDDKIYVLTSKEKNVSNQIDQNNNVCIVAYDNENWIRINCKLVDDSTNTKAKEKFLMEFPGLLECGYNLENKNMQILYMSEAESVFYNEDGKEIVNYRF